VGPAGQAELLLHKVGEKTEIWQKMRPASDERGVRRPGAGTGPADGECSNGMAWLRALGSSTEGRQEARLSGGRAATIVAVGGPRVGRGVGEPKTKANQPSVSENNLYVDGIPAGGHADYQGRANATIVVKAPADHQG